MPQQIASTIENTFTGGLKTEFTGLNFPAHAATDTDNCIYTLLGNVMRRSGFNYENNFNTIPVDRTNLALSSFIWNNVGGNGNKRFYVFQTGAQLVFFDISVATLAAQLSTRKIASNIQMATFSPSGAPAPDAYECQFAEGNGYLFVFHPYLEPFYVTYSASTNTFTGHKIELKIRDFQGIVETNVSDQTRPFTLTSEHTYNLMNQGWLQSPDWNTNSITPQNGSVASKVFIVDAGLPVTLGQNISARDPVALASSGASGITLYGTVSAYAGTSLTMIVTASSNPAGLTTQPWYINPIAPSLITAWNTAEGNYPSNADVWWRFKDTNETFNPAVTQANITLNSGPASKGFFVLNAFNQDRSSVTGIAGLIATTTIARPKTGTWFQGRLWYTGIEASQVDLGNSVFYSWTETIYFSQVVENNTQFGRCYQENDPTAEDFFDELSTDGGVINIQGCGSIHKLFPIQNGMLVFAANGIWFITGSQGIGFSANDYTVTKISSIRSIASTSFVDVNGYPIFWNEEGIYTVTPSQQGGGLVVDNLCYGSILTFYSSIPKTCKQYVRGDYDPRSFVLSWVYRSTDETTITDRYEFDRVLNFNTANKSFYPYSLSSSTKIHDVKYVIPTVSGTAYPDPIFKYICSTGGPSIWSLTFAEERDSTNWKDFITVDGVGINYISHFVTGYRLTSKGLTKFNPIYFQFFSNAEVPTAYKIQGIWDYANSPNSGKYTTIQIVTNTLTRFGHLIRRHKIRGSGLSLQLKIISVDGMPFNIVGWTSMEAQNASM